MIRFCQINEKRYQLTKYMANRPDSFKLKFPRSQNAHTRKNVKFDDLYKYRSQKQQTEPTLKTPKIQQANAKLAAPRTLELLSPKELRRTYRIYQEFQNTCYTSTKSGASYRLKLIKKRIIT